MGNPFVNLEIAQQYDQFYKTRVGKIYDFLEKKAISQLLRQQSRGDMLEVGCGTGHWTEYFASLGYQITAIDESDPMINIAKQKNIGFTKFKVMKAEDYHLEKPTSPPKKRKIFRRKRNSPDAWKFIAAAFMTSLEFMDHPKKILRHIIQYVQSDGYLIFGILNANSPLAAVRSEDPIYKEGRYFSEQDLKNLLSPFGSVVIQQCAFPTPKMIQEQTNAAILNYEYAAQDAGRTDGIFLAVRVDLNYEN